MLPFGDNFGLGAHSVRGAGLGMAWFDLVHGSCYWTGWLFLLGAFRNGDGRFRGSARFLTWLALLLCACVCLRWMARYLLVEPGFFGSLLLLLRIWLGFRGGWLQYRGAQVADHLVQVACLLCWTAPRIHWVWFGSLARLRRRMGHESCSGAGLRTG